MNRSLKCHSNFFGVTYIAIIHVTRFAKVRLIASKRNCGYSPFLLSKLILVDFLFSSNKKKMLYIHILVIAGELSKD